MAHAVAWGLYKQRRDIGRLTLGAFKRSKKLGVTVLVDVAGGTDLVPITLWDAHKMTLIELATFVQARVDKARAGKDKLHKKS
jgi:hypothetical protein